MLATMVAQNGPMPKLFSKAEIGYLMTGSLNDINCEGDFSQDELQAFQEANICNYYWAWNKMKELL